MNPFKMSHEKAKAMLTIFRLAKLRKQVDAYSNLCENDPTPEECDKFIKDCSRISSCCSAGLTFDEAGDDLAICAKCGEWCSVVSEE